MAIEQRHDRGTGGRTKLKFSFVDIFPNVLTAVMKVKITLTVRHESHKQGTGREFLQWPNVYPSATSPEIMQIVGFKQLTPSPNKGNLGI